MTDETSKTPTSETDTVTAEPGQAPERDAKPAKADKPKKMKVGYSASMPRTEVVSYFEAIVGGLRSGRLEFRQEGEELVLNPPDQLEVEVKASRKGDKGKVVFEIEWTGDGRPLEILN